MNGFSPRVAVIGAGTMGHGIAYVAAVAGCEVRLTDARRAALPQALDKIEALVVSGVKRGKLAADEHAAVRTELVFVQRPQVFPSRQVVPPPAFSVSLAAR